MPRCRRKQIPLNFMSHVSVSSGPTKSGVVWEAAQRYSAWKQLPRCQPDTSAGFSAKTTFPRDAAEGEVMLRNWQPRVGAHKARAHRGVANR